MLERDRPGSEASWAAAGMLTPLAEARQPGPFLDLLIASREQYPSFAAALREETGIDVGYQDAGTLALAFSEADQTELNERFAWQSAAGLDVEELSAAAARALEPAISPGVRTALFFRERSPSGQPPARPRAGQRGGARGAGVPFGRGGRSGLYKSKGRACRRRAGQWRAGGSSNGSGGGGKLGRPPSAGSPGRYPCTRFTGSSSRWTGSPRSSLTWWNPPAATWSRVGMEG